MRDQQQTPTTIQATSKRWKMWQLLGWLGFVAGLVLLVVGLFNDNMDVADLAPTAFLMIGVGAVAVIVGTFFAWWHHG